MPAFATSHEVLASLKQQQYAPVYFLQGAEPYYIDQVCAFVEKHVLTEEERPFNLHIHYGRETNLQELLTYARTFPMIGQRQVILVKEAHELTDLQKSSSQEQLEAYLQAPNKRTLLLLAYKGKALPANGRLSKALAQQGILLTTQRVSERALGHWIQEHLDEQGYRITPEATLLLESLIGPQLHRLVSHLQKIALNLAPGATITHSMVATHVGMQKDISIFDLQKALGQQDYYKAAFILNYFAAHPKKYPLPALLHLLTTYFSKLLALQQLRHLPPSSLPKALNIHPYFAPDYLKAAKKYSTEALSDRIAALHHADLQYKGIEHAPLEEQDILKELAAALAKP